MVKICPLFSGVFLLAALLCAPGAEAQVTVDRSIFYWKQGTVPVQNVTVRNSADLPILVEVRAEEVLEPGTPNERREVAKDIIVAPKRFSISAKGERMVRLLRKIPATDRERVFRVSFVPQSIESTAEEKEAATHFTGRLQTTLKVLSGVGILIFLQPEQIDAKLTAERHDDTVVLQNSGNVNILLSRIQKCTKPGEGCEPLTAKRLYPGNSLEISGVSGKVLTVTKRIGDEFSEETIQ